jgi:hypothetical protein
MRQSFEMLFKANDPAQGGSFYLQSKVYRAKEKFDTEYGRAPAAPPPPTDSPGSSSDSSSSDSGSSGGNRRPS